MTTLLDVQKLSRDFGGVRAVNQVDFQVREGEILALIGPNGAGKSTVLNMVSGVIPPSEGEIRFSNQPLTRVQGYEYAGLGITRTFQNLQTFDDMTVLENVMVGMHTQTSASLFSCGMNLAKSRKEEKMMQEQAQTWIENVGLAEEASLLAGSLPYGKLRLMEIARAMVAKPRLLLLDEPAAGLNHTETAEMSRMFCEIRDNGTAILLVEHDMDMIMMIADRIVVLDQGSKIAEGTPREIQENPRVIAAYLGAE
ncbi:ABC transporter ATP-binding protein [Brevibacillus porteri]|uniref:High-affinity branched-chain amino acid ABC transporter ATP-binding protein LivG n=1 Tax=Brevibacillus porteri TaxID=2126350 RepID=A0ABX5FSX9_9BACL|nr:ABC transporter ATP-binding protein [Brevibacillus porteri]MED1799440.1 ABC transporter ATP-binding protein [Brevibacillus porteri]MED2131914.1 ABC transporter ATP-binding protein [Brevibacillus porteri]MED2742764.1 ABC transporter ATP-binding protein [Brevibacillus porteri]MED2817963.1 ABC transporter ATP-binding protein [Brevibacillus porteri]MED2893203.1 ABC transporter ATP-binding protein [Brevibacillus porteri]